MLPDGIKSGEPSRLIPVVADTSKESRITSVALAMMTHIPELAGRLLGTVGIRTGMRTKIEAYTEVVFGGEEYKKDRPDGLLVVSTGKNVWRALIEAKIGNAALDADQVKRYAELARAHKIDAVITLSNEFTARADHHPTTTLPKGLANKVSLFHWPWMWVRTQAELIELDKSVNDVEQIFLLNEFLRFLTHDSTGLTKFNQMPKEWKTVVGTVRDNGALKKTSSDVEAVVSAWQQESKDIALDLSRYVGRRVEVRLSRKQQNSPADFLKDGCCELSERHTLSCSLQIPDAAGDLVVVADLGRRTVSCSMRLSAPEERQSTKARVNWLVRQLAKTESEDLQIRAIRRGQAENTMRLLTELRGAPETMEVGKPDIVPGAFEVVLIRDLAGRFSASQKFIEELEAAVHVFYDEAVQHLKAWQPSAPKPIKKEESLPPNEGDEMDEAAK